MSELEYSFGDIYGSDFDVSYSTDENGILQSTYSFVDYQGNVRFYRNFDAAKQGYREHQQLLSERFDDAAGAFSNAYEGAMGYLVNNVDNQGRVIIDRGAINNFRSLAGESFNTLTNYAKDLHKFGRMVPIGKTFDLAKIGALIYEGRTADAIEELAKTVVTGGVSAVGGAVAAGMIASATAAGLVALGPITAALLVGGVAALTGFAADKAWSAVSDAIGELDESNGTLALSLTDKSIAYIGTGVSDIINAHLGKDYFVDVIGNGGRDIITVSGGHIDVAGGEGDDEIQIYGLSAIVEGGKGNDTILTDLKQITLKYNEGDGCDTVRPGGSWATATIESDLNLLGVTIKRFSDGSIVEYNGEDIIKLKWFGGVEFLGANSELIARNYLGSGFKMDAWDIRETGPVTLTSSPMDHIHIHRREDPENADIIAIEDKKTYIELDNVAFVVLNQDTPGHVIVANDDLAISLRGVSERDIIFRSNDKGEFDVYFLTSGSVVRFYSKELAVSSADSTVIVEFDNGVVWQHQDFLANLSKLSPENPTYYGSDGADSIEVTTSESYPYNYYVKSGDGDDIVTVSGLNPRVRYHLDGGAGLDTYNLRHGGVSEIEIVGGMQSGEHVNFLGSTIDSVNIVEDSGRYVISSGNNSLYLGVADPGAQDFFINGVKFSDIKSGHFRFSLSGSDEGELIIGGIFDDDISSGAGDDELHGGFGNDKLDGGAGDDYLIGGDGSDTFYFGLGSGRDRIVGNDLSLGELDIVQLGPGIRPEDVVLRRGIDEVGSLTLYIKDTSDRLLIGSYFYSDYGDGYGGSYASDVVDQIRFYDGTIWERSTIELLAMRSTTEESCQLYGSLSADTLSGLGGGDFLYGMGSDDLISGGAGNDELYGGDGDDTLDGGTDADYLYGGDGNDTLSGGQGADQLFGGVGNDSYVINDVGDIVTEWFDEGTDTVKSSVSWTLTENLENLTLTGRLAINGTGNTGNNTLIGNSANNVLFGGGGNDILNGGRGADQLFGGTGNDSYVINDVGDIVTEWFDEGIDTIKSSVNWTLGDNLENLTLTGNISIDGVGNTGNNTLIGNSANNTLSGKAGSDALKGGAGDDTYLFGRGDGVDTVTETDATVGNTDVALFSVDVNQGQLWFRRTANSLEVSIIDTNDKLTIRNWYLGEQYRVEQFKTTNGRTLLGSQVQALVDAMASFGVPVGGESSLTTEQRAQLDLVISTNWQ